MNLIENYAVVQNSITYVKAYKKKFVTNFFIDEKKILTWILDKSFFFIQKEEVVFFIKKNDTFYSLFFIASTIIDLQASLNLLLKEYTTLTFVSDIIIKEENSEIQSVFEKSDFQIYTSLFRMNKLHYDPLIEFSIITNLKEAVYTELDELIRLFNQYFDPYAEQIPNKSELLDWINVKNILVYKINNKIIGFIIYDLNGSTIYLRYWFVHPEYREQKIGTALFKYFLFKGRSTKRQLLWVIKSNDNAIKRYKHYGFIEEKMFNFVMIKDKQNL